MRINLFTMIESFFKHDASSEYLEKLIENSDFGLDIDELYKYRDAEDYFSSQAFSKAINAYYESLDNRGKENFYEDLSESYLIPSAYATDSTIYYRYQHQLARNRAIAFSQIDSEEKYERAKLNILYAALDVDLIPPVYVCDALSRFRKDYDNDSIKAYLQGFSDGKHLPIQLTKKEIDDLINGKTDFSEKQMLSIINNADDSSLLEYLQEKREDSVGIVFRGLEIESEIKILEFYSDDPIYQAKLLLDSEIVSANCLEKCFSCIEDDYLKYEISHANDEISKRRFVDKEASLERIKRFLKIKEEFFSLSSDEERKDFLAGLTFDDSSEEKDALRHEKINQVKKSLLKYIPSHEDRMEIIESMAVYRDPDIEPYCDAIYEMVREYFEDNCDLTNEQRERMEIAFRQNDVYFENYENSATEGCLYHTSKQITIANRNRDNPDMLLKYLVHEYSHAMSMYDFETTWYQAGKTFEEGMADTFAEQVLNHYFQKHKEINIAGKTISYGDEPIIISKTAYKFENGWVKSMLYPLEEERTDKLAIQEYLLGDKKEFFDLVLGDGFMQGFMIDYKGNPINVEFSESNLVNQHYGQYLDVDTENLESLYFYTNDRIKSLKDKSIEFVQNMEEDQERIEEYVELSETEKRIQQIQLALEDGVIVMDKKRKNVGSTLF